MSLSIKVEVSAGTSEGDAAKDMARLATKLQLLVEGDFNGLTMFAIPDETPEEVLLRFERDLRLENYPQD